MYPRPRIACAVEQSEASRHAVDASRWLASELDASIVVVHAFDEWAVGVPSTRDLTARSMTDDHIVDAARQTAHEMLQDASTALAGVEHTVELVEAAPVEGVLRAVRDHDANLLVTGTAARDGLDRILLGSVAGELVARAPCPVTVVSAGALLGRPGPVLVAYDGSDHSLAAARLAVTLATRMARRLVLLHVPADRAATDDEVLAAGGRALAEGRTLDLQTEIAPADGDTVEAIVRAAHRHDASLVVAGTRGLGALTAALLGSVSAGLVRSVERPVVLASAP